MRGGQWQALHLMRGLAEAGIEGTLLAPEGAPLAAEARRAGLRVERFGVAALWRESRGADLVHAHDARAHAVAAAAARRPVVVARRVAFPVKRGAASRWKYGRAARFIAVSRFVAGRLMEAGVAEERIDVVYDAAPAVRPQRMGERIVSLATDDPMKGRALVEKACWEMGVEFSRDLQRDLPGARVFVYITREEGLGSAALLAMALGVPVVASRVGGLPEAVEDGVSGLLVENDAAAIAAAVRRVMEDDAMAARMGEAGRRRAGERFSVAEMTRGTLAAYRKVPG